MVLVSINVLLMEDMITKIRTFARTLKDEHNALAPAADDALVPTYQLRPDQERFDRLIQIATDLRNRVDLAVAINGNSINNTLHALGMPITYETAGDSDTLDDMRTLVGLKLAADLTDATAEEPLSDASIARLDATLSSVQRYSRDEGVMAALYGELGADGVVALADFFVRDSMNDLDGDHDYAVVNRSRMAALTDGLVTYTGSDEFRASEVAAASGEKFADTFADLGMGTTGAGLKPFGVSEMLLGATYDATFLLDVGSRFYENETSARYRDNYLGAPFESYFESLSRVPEASLGFFSGADKEARAQYFIVDREWPLDDFDSIGDALDVAATSFHTVDDPRASDGAWVASTTVHLLGERGQVPDAAKDSIGHILGEYIYDVDRLANTSGVGGGAVGARPPDANEDWEQGLPVGAHFELTNLLDVMSQTLTDEEAVKAVAHGAADWNAHRLGHAAASWSGEATDIEGARQAMTASAGLQGFVLSTMGVGLVDDARETDTNAQMYIDLTSDVVALAPKVGGSTAFVRSAAADRWTGNAERVGKEQALVRSAGYADLQIAFVVALDQHDQISADSKSDTAGVTYPWFALGGFDPESLEDPDVRDRFDVWVNGSRPGTELNELLGEAGGAFDDGVRRVEDHA